MLHLQSSSAARPCREANCCREDDLRWDLNKTEGEREGGQGSTRESAEMLIGFLPSQAPAASDHSCLGDVVLFSRRQSQSWKPKQVNESRELMS